MARCDFCKKHIEPGTGKKYVQKDGKVLDFCSTKCEKNLLKLKRKPRQTRWTKEYQTIKKGAKK
jgi:large subunit ribosomal protein L24e